MRNFLIIILLILGLASCSPNIGPAEAPSSPSPSNGAAGISTTGVNLSWNSTYLKGDQSINSNCDIYFGSNSANIPQLASSVTSPYQISTTLDSGKTYYWYVIAYNENSDSTVGPSWHFTTVEQATNSAPNTPSNPSPSNGASNQSIDISLNWTGGDPDPGDTVKYDVYFGTSSNPPLVSSNLANTAYNPGALNYSVTYYWKISAKDNHGSSTVGAIWSFTTEQARFYKEIGGNEYYSISGNFYDPDPSYGSPWIALSSYGTSGANAGYSIVGLNATVIETLTVWVYSFDNGTGTDGEHYHVYNYNTQQWDYWGASDKSEKWHGFYTCGSDLGDYIASDNTVCLWIESGWSDHSHIRTVAIEEKGRN